MLLVGIRAGCYGWGKNASGGLSRIKINIITLLVSYMNEQLMYNIYKDYAIKMPGGKGSY